MAIVSLSLDTERLAHDYDRISAAHQFRIGQLLIGDLAIMPGAKALDVGCGTGLLTEYVAGLTGPTGCVVGIDPLPLRIALAQQKNRSNLSFQVGTAYDLREFPATSFDVVYLNAVLNWLPEKVTPLREVHRVLKTGGLLGISGGAGKDNPNHLQAIKEAVSNWLPETMVPVCKIYRALKRAGRSGLPASSSKDFSSHLQAIRALVLAREPYCRYAQAQGERVQSVNASELGKLLATTGFTVKRLEERRYVRHHPTPEAAIDLAEASSFGNFLGHLPAHLRTTAREEIARSLDEFNTPGGIPEERVVLMAVALKP